MQELWSGAFLEMREDLGEQVVSPESGAEAEPQEGRAVSLCLPVELGSSSHSVSVGTHPWRGLSDLAWPLHPPSGGHI